MPRWLHSPWFPRLTLLLLPLLYTLTLARGLVLGDPTEYTFVANVLGIAHPPGYAFITLMGKLFQTLIPFGEIPWRMHLLAATAATMAAVALYSLIATIAARLTPPPDPLTRFFAPVAALFAALGVGTAADFWQHANHANPHIITATFLSVNLFLLTRWWASGQDGYLYAFCLTAGLGVTHHPLAVFAFPAYAGFILWTRPRLLRQWRVWLKMVAFVLLGLSAWLYFPLRSPMQPVFGPHDMNTLAGFLNVVLARGLRVNLFYFGPADQVDRVLVFWSLLRLQYTLPTIALALVGAGWLARRRERQPLLLLYGLALLGNYLFVINTVQDVMAYLLGPFLLVGLFSGIGLYALLHLMQQQVRFASVRPLLLLAGSLMLLGPALQITRNLPRLSLADYDDGDAYVRAVFTQFAGSGERAVLLNDWEHMTPLWYTKFVAGRWPDPADVRPEFVSTARPWVESVFDYLPGGPVYLSGYRREIVAAGFRLRPVGAFYQVVEPGDATLPPVIKQLPSRGEPVAIVGYELPQSDVTAGDYVPLSLAMRASITTTDYFVPVLQVGNLTYTFTTDSHLITPLWQAGEVIVERFDFALPAALDAGTYPITAAMHNLITAATGPAISLGSLTVAAQPYPPPTTHLLGNFRQRIGLVSATARAGIARWQAPWAEPIPIQPGETVHLTLQWECLALAEESYTIFVHLIDAANRPMVELDYTPLGGAAPTYLWIPKWLPGQRLLDPYNLTIPDNLAAGIYYVEVGLYEMTSGRRLHMADNAGNLIGDRLILGSLHVQP
ncbi:MAG: hypothetical protein Fur0021_17750 [Candidatus Promineifilaceae bacterium]